jgi:FkbM family methyltransferase
MQIINDPISLSELDEITTFHVLGSIKLYGATIPFWYLRDRFVGQHIEKRHLWERFTAHCFLLAISEFFESPKGFLDIGAHWGQYSVIMAKFFPKCVIHAFEPLFINYDLLVKNVSTLPCATTYKYAISDKNEDEAKFYLCSDNSGYSSLIEPTIEEERTKAFQSTCEVRTIDYFKIDLDTIDVVKIDTEGHDYVILKSLLPKLKPGTLIIVEVLSQTSERILELIREYDLQIVATIPLEQNVILRVKLKAPE